MVGSYTDWEKKIERRKKMTTDAKKVVTYEEVMNQVKGWTKQEESRAARASGVEEPESAKSQGPDKGKPADVPTAKPEEPPPAEPPQDPEKDEEELKEPPDEKSSKVWIWIVIVVLLAILAGGGWWKYYATQNVQTEIAQLQSDLAKNKSELAKAKGNLAKLEAELKAFESMPSTPKAEVSPVPTVKKTHKFVAPTDKMSIVDLLKSLGMESDFCSRRDLYFQAGGKGKYRGTAKQNIFLLRYLKEQKKAEAAPEEKVASSGQISSGVPDINSEIATNLQGQILMTKKEGWQAVSEKIEKAVIEIIGNVDSNGTNDFNFKILGPVNLAEPEKQVQVIIIGPVKLPPDENIPMRGGG